MTLGSLVTLALFGWLSTLIFSLEPCPINTFESGDLCYDCLAPLDNCKTCSKQNICDTCNDGYYVNDVVVAGIQKSVCMPCTNIHNELGKTCDKDRQLSCIDTIGTFISLYEGICYDCLKLDENAATCDNEGPFTCQAGFYLDTDAEGNRKCQWC